MTRITMAAFICLMLTSLQARAIAIHGVEIPSTTTIPGENTQLLLNGAGIREKFFLDIYVGALYLVKATHEPDAILADTGPASIHMHFVYDEVSKEKITSGWTEGLEANLSSERMQAIRPSLESFNSLFRSVVAGDVIYIDYLPGQGTRVRINDEVRGSVEGNDFFRDLLRIWLGANPVSKSLQRSMLGLD